MDKISSSDMKLKQMLETILESCLHISNTQYGEIGIIDERSGITYIVYQEDNLDELYLAPNEGFTAFVVTEGQTLIIPDVSNPQSVIIPKSFAKKAHLYQHKKTRKVTKSEILIPIMLEPNFVYGVINLQSPYLNWFDSKSMKNTLESFARQAATGILNYRLGCRLETLRNFGRNLTHVSNYEILSTELNKLSDKLFTSTFKVGKNETFTIPHVGAVRLLTWTNIYTRQKDVLDKSGAIYSYIVQYRGENAEFEKFIIEQPYLFDTVKTFPARKKLIKSDNDYFFILNDNTFAN